MTARGPVVLVLPDKERGRHHGVCRCLESTYCVQQTAAGALGLPSVSRSQERFRNNKNSSSPLICVFRLGVIYQFLVPGPVLLYQSLSSTYIHPPSILSCVCAARGTSMPRLMQSPHPRLSRPQATVCSAQSLLLSVFRKWHPSRSRTGLDWRRRRIL
jgi:hypothetical protein